ncbi:MAG: chemotaxis protein CheR [Gemmatimonas sp. SG8_23]|nr:MAG: chemotaxis protein CheR [Gemmatimonas sp. SG8_23]
MRDADCVAFLQWALPRLEMRWSGFRRVRRQVCKRLRRRLAQLALEGLDDYRRYLDEHPAEWGTLDACCRITISRFYRDRAVFDTIRDPILPALARIARQRDDRTIRCWSAGCASGEEPYSLSLAWKIDVSPRAPGVDLSLVATDVDAGLLERARVGCYPTGSLRELPSDWIAAAFETADDLLCLRGGYRSGVEFVRQDIRREMPEGPFDLVLCRNLVFTYFEVGVQGTLLERILRAMTSRGLLVLGGHEALPPGHWPFDRPYGSLPIYRRTE